MTKHKYKDVRNDGYIFCGYFNDHGTEREKWLSPDAFIRWRKGVIERNKRIRKTKDGRAHQARLAREYKARNPHLRAKHNRKRLGLEMTAFGASPKFMRQFYLTRDRLTNCTGISWHVDHVVPLSRGGVHHENNLQVVTASNNYRKHARLVA